MPFFHDQSRTGLRKMYLDAWRKFQNGTSLELLEKQVAAVIAEHPEYHTLLEDEETALHAEFPPEAGMSNPFLHMSMHLAIRDQVGTDRPAGIAAEHSRLARLLGDAHQAEHAMLEVLAESLWEAQQAGRVPDELAYLTKIKNL